MKSFLKKVLLVIAIILLAVIIAVIVHFYLSMDTLAGYTAKRMCSGVFVAQRTPESLQQGELSILPWAEYDIRRKERTVHAELFGSRRTAVYREGLGCTTIQEPQQEEDLRSRAQGIRPLAQEPPNSEGFSLESGPLPETVDPEALDRAMQEAFFDSKEQEPTTTRCVLIVQDGRIIAERYAQGFSADTPMPGWSMGKTVVNALVGILVRDGRLALSDPAPVPEWNDPSSDSPGNLPSSSEDPRQEITIEDLLRMRSGLEFSEVYFNPASDVLRMLFDVPDTAHLAASQPLEQPPGTDWSYSSGTTNILSRIIRDTVGGTEAAYYEFMKEELFIPMGITTAVPEFDVSGTFIGSSFIFMTPRDWARFGMLYANDGVVNGRRILPAGWVEYSGRSTPGSWGGKFGAHVWTNAGGGEEQWMEQLPADLITAWGFEEQYVTVVPSYDLVIVRTGLDFLMWDWDTEGFLTRVLQAFSPPKED